MTPFLLIIPTSSPNNSSTPDKTQQFGGMYSLGDDSVNKIKIYNVKKFYKHKISKVDLNLSDS